MGRLAVLVSAAPVRVRHRGAFNYPLRPYDRRLGDNRPREHHGASRHPRTGDGTHIRRRARAVPRRISDAAPEPDDPRVRPVVPIVVSGNRRSYLPLAAFGEIFSLGAGEISSARSDAGDTRYTARGFAAASVSDGAAFPRRASG